MQQDSTTPDLRAIPSNRHAQLEDIDVNELLYYFTSKSDSIAVNRLRSGFVLNLRQLAEITEQELRSIPYVGASTMSRVAAFRTWLAANVEQVVAGTAVLTERVYIPTPANATGTLLAKLRMALCELASMLDSRADNPRFARNNREYNTLRLAADIMHCRYVKLMPFAEIAKRTNRTSWHVTKTHSDILSRLFGGTPVATNIYLKPDMAALVKDVQENYVFRRCALISDAEGEIDEFILNTMGVSLLEVVPGLRLCVPSGKKSRFVPKSRAVMRGLRETVIPMDREALTGLILEMPEFKEKPDEHDIDFIEAITTDAEVVEVVDDPETVKVNSDHLGSDEQRIARLIFNHEDWLTRADIVDLFKDTFGRPPRQVNLSNLKKYRIYSSGDRWAYDAPLQSVRRYIAEWTQHHNEFYMDELNDALAREGYPTGLHIRPYITSACLVDNQDPEHFCLKSATSEYPEYNWRRPGRSGLTNWILNCLNDLISKAENGVTISEALDYVEGCAQEEKERHHYIRTRTKTAICRYCGADQPFVLDGDRVKLNGDVHARTEFSTIGRRGHNTADYAKHLRETAYGILKAAERECMPLVEMIHHINVSTGREHSRNTVVRALSNVYLQTIPLSVDNVDGTVYVRLVGNA